MFEGTPISHFNSPDIFLFTISLTILGIIVWIRQGFLKEWRLADWLINNMNRIWQRGADEVPQAEGILVNHLAGIIALSTITWFDLPFYISLGIGAGIVISRQIMFSVLGVIHKTSQLGNEHNIIDRLSRLWMSAGIGAIALILSLIPSHENFNPLLLFLVVWGMSILFRWFRVFQSAKRRLHSFSYSFLYLCALEIFPVLASMIILDATTMWI
jgi:hypothetical protein